MSSESFIVNNYYVRDNETKVSCNRKRITNIIVNEKNSITYLLCSKNLIKELPLLTTACTHIDLSENRLTKVDKIPGKMNHLNISRNRVQYINFYNFTNNLQYLNINHNFIREIPYLPENLTTFICCNNQLKTLPEKLPLSLKVIKCCNNRIEFLPNILPITLKVLACKNNNLKYIPDSIMRCNLLMNLKYNGNKSVKVKEEILEFIDQVIRRNRDRERVRNNCQIDTNKNIRTVYRDGQNVHTDTIEKSVLESLQKIVNDTVVIKQNINECLEEFDNIVNNTEEIIIVKDDDLIYDTPYKKLEYLCSIEYRHIQLELTFAEIFVHIWNKIRASPYCNEIVKILINELDEMLSVCFTGRVSRLVNCLNGFDDIVNINISETEQIQAKYDIIDKKLLHNFDKSSLEYNVMFKYWFTDLLREIKISDEKIEEWISPFNDFIEEYINNVNFVIDENILERIRADYRIKFLNYIDKYNTNIIEEEKDEVIY